MDNPRPDKVAKVAEITEKLEAAGTVLVTEYRGLDVPAQATLRQAVRDAGGEYKIYKNSLAKLAAENAGVDLAESLSGPTALAFAYPAEDSGLTDPVGISKALVEFSKTNDALVIKGGLMDGAPLSVDDVTALSKVPPREELLAQFAGLLQAPMSKFAGLLQALPREMAGLIKALVDKGGATNGADEDTGAGVGEEAAPAAAEDAAEPASEEAAEAAAEEAAAEAASEETDGAAEAAPEEETDESADAGSEDPDTKED